MPPDQRPDQRPGLFSPVDPDAGDLPDAFGPDGVRVTLRVEPAVDRLRRWRYRLLAPSPLAVHALGRLSYRTLPGLVQRHLLRDRWVVAVEADSGEHCRVRATDREEAVDLARAIHAGVTRDGVAFLHTFAR